MKIALFCTLLAGLTLLSGCASDGSTANTKQQAVLGGLGGAVVGGVIGHQSGKGLEGAAVGGAVGAAAGGVMGSAKDEKSATTNQR